MLADKVAHLSSEHQRWLFRMRLRPEGFIFDRSFPAQINIPVLQINGSMDPSYSARSAEKSLRRTAHADSESVLLYGVGHYPHIEDPPAIAELIAPRV